MLRAICGLSFYFFKDLNKMVERYLPDWQIHYLRKAYVVACYAHEGQIRSTGEPYITHPVSVACILAEMKLDGETLVAALLHDVIEDSSVTYQDMEKLFGKNVAKLIEGVSKLDKFQFRNKKEAQAENFRKMIKAMVQDIRVILIKLADRTHNMRTLWALRPDKQRRIALDTLEIYTPLAHRLGIHLLKTELEELGFQALYPDRYRIIKEIIRTARSNCNGIILKVLSEINERLKEAGIKCCVSGRERHIYSIYQKMYLKEKRFHSIMDIYAFRVIVKDLDACYRVLGQIHNLYKPRSGRIKDYIAIPKVNGYQSLHTSMIGPRGVPIEVQIRTEDMDEIAKIGIAAHWVYKKNSRRSIIAQIRVERWLQSLLELQKITMNSFEFVENVKSDLFLNEIYVFTPKGRIVYLPSGSTPVDFAYALNSNIGHACVAARIDKKFYPLSHLLVSGQTVEIITSLGARPNISWLNFVVSFKARAKIHQLLKNIRYEESKNINFNLFGYEIETTLQSEKKVSVKKNEKQPDSVFLNFLLEFDFCNKVFTIISAKFILTENFVF